MTFPQVAPGLKAKIIGKYRTAVVLPLIKKEIKKYCFVHLGINVQASSDFFCTEIIKSEFFKTMSFHSQIRSESFKTLYLCSDCFRFEKLIS